MSLGYQGQPGQHIKTLFQKENQLTKKSGSIS